MKTGKIPNGLASAMRAAGVGPTALGRLVGTSKQNIERWAAGHRVLKSTWAQKIAPHLQTTPEQLMLPDTVELPARIDPAEESAFYGLDPQPTERRLLLIQEATGIDIARFLGADNDDWGSIIGDASILSDMAANRIAIATGLPVAYVLSGEPRALTALLLSAKRGRLPA